MVVKLYSRTEEIRWSGGNLRHYCNFGATQSLCDLLPLNQTWPEKLFNSQVMRETPQLVKTKKLSASLRLDSSCPRSQATKETCGVWGRCPDGRVGCLDGESPRAACDGPGVSDIQVEVVEMQLEEV